MAISSWVLGRSHGWISHTRRYTLAASGIVVALGAAACGSSTTQNPAPTSAKPALFRQLPESIQKSGVLHNGADFTYPPMEYTGPDGTSFTGVDYDLAQAIGAKLGVKVVYSNAPFGTMIPSLQAGHVDMVTSFATLTKEREKVVDFIQYSQSGTVIMVKKGNAKITSLESLCGKTVGLQAGSVQIPIAQQQNQKCVAAGKPTININQIPTDSAVQMLLRSGRIDADLLDSPVASYSVSKSSDFEVVPGSYVVRPHGIMLIKGNDKLRDVIFAAVKELMADGTYTKIMTKYHVTDIALPDTKINGASG